MGWRCWVLCVTSAWACSRADAPPTPTSFDAEVLPADATATADAAPSVLDISDADYDLMVREFALPVVEMQPGALAAAPIRTPFGWHVPRLDQIKPAESKTPADPAVRRDIAEHIVDAVRTREAERFVFGLFQRYGVKFFFEGSGAPATGVGPTQAPDEP